MSTQPSARARQLRGQAMVEMVVSLVVMVPLVLYALFLSDFLMHSLDWHETIVAPAWQGLAYDFVEEQVAWRNPDPPLWECPGGGLNCHNEPTTYFKASSHPVFKGSLDLKVQGIARLTYCDFSSAYDSYYLDSHHDVVDVWDPVTGITAPECNNNLRQSLGARITWLGNGSTQIECQLDPNLARVPDPGFPDQATDRKSGFLSCRSRPSITNRLIGKFVYGWGGETEMTDRAKSQSTTASAGDSWLLTGLGPQGSQFGMLHGSWSLNYIKNLDPRYADENRQSHPDDSDPDDPQDTHPLYIRVRHYYAAPGPPHQAVTAAKKFGDGLVDPASWAGVSIPGSILSTISGYGLLSPDAVKDGPIGNNPETPTIAYRRTARAEANFAAWTSHPRADPNKVDANQYQQQVFARHLGYSRDWGMFDVESTAAGWADPLQRASWDNRAEPYFGRPEQTWVDSAP